MLLFLLAILVVLGVVGFVTLMVAFHTALEMPDNYEHVHLCPRCQSEHHRIATNNIKLTQVICNVCGYSSAESACTAGAIRHWNSIPNVEHRSTSLATESGCNL